MCYSTLMPPASLFQNGLHSLRIISVSFCLHLPILSAYPFSTSDPTLGYLPNLCRHFCVSLLSPTLLRNPSRTWLILLWPSLTQLLLETVCSRAGCPLRRWCVDSQQVPWDGGCFKAKEVYRSGLSRTLLSKGNDESG